MSATLVETVPNLAGAAMMLLGLLLPLGRRRAPAAAPRLVAWQGGLLALAAASAAWSGAGARHLWFLALGALLARALLLPALLRLWGSSAGYRSPVSEHSRWVAYIAHPLTNAVRRSEVVIV